MGREDFLCLYRKLLQKQKNARAKYKQVNHTASEQLRMWTTNRFLGGNHCGTILPFTPRTPLQFRLDFVSNLGVANHGIFYFEVMFLEDCFTSLPQTITESILVMNAV